MKLVEMLHGSRLYGTHSDTSDYDYKGVALPSVKDLKLGIVPYGAAGPELERLIDEVEVLATVSELPDAPDEKWAYDFLERVTKEHVTGIPDEEGNIYPRDV